MNNEKALKYIKSAWMTAIACSVITLLGMLLSILANSDFLGLDLYSLVDVALLLGLAFGVYKKSRVCAVILFIYFILDKLYMLSSGVVNRGAIMMSIAFGTWFFQGIIGTIHYHKNKKMEINGDSQKF
ncbi:hypothetical protein [Clostridium sp. UBA6640]|uniref:hypothetical protein n=1 Tax=Clostridium sp. UBA6640 TaxID=1946370 RepID=UPI0025BA2C93|nr:hypothetical protein [Clostridium sp. UBA6640]